jgi:hypothetical protein
LSRPVGCGISALATARFSTAVTVSQTTSVCVAAVEMVTWMVEMAVDVSISAITTVARCVAMRVMVWRMVDVTVTVTLWVVN